MDSVARWMINWNMGRTQILNQNESKIQHGTGFEAISLFNIRDIDQTHDLECLVAGECLHFEILDWDSNWMTRNIRVTKRI